MKQQKVSSRSIQSNTNHPRTAHARTDHATHEIRARCASDQGRASAHHDRVTQQHRIVVVHRL
jgi:hypothetical protein